jgi:hypothetical protein
MRSTPARPYLGRLLGTVLLFVLLGPPIGGCTITLAIDAYWLATASRITAGGLALGAAFALAGLGLGYAYGLLPAAVAELVVGGLRFTRLGHKTFAIASAAAGGLVAWVTPEVLPGGFPGVELLAPGAVAGAVCGWLAWLIPDETSSDVTR